MRITQQERKFIKELVHVQRPHAEVYLFGSRVNDKAKGGDIDILIISEPKLHWKEIGKMELSFWREFGEQKIDFVSFSIEDDSPFKKIALIKAMSL